MKIRNPFKARENSASPNNASGGSYASNAVTIGSSNPSGSLSVSAWYRASEVLAGTMSQLLLEYQKKNDKTHGGNYEVDDTSVEGKKLNYLLKVRPNPMMSASQFLSQMCIKRFFDGNAVAYIERDNYGEVEAIWLCSTATMNTTSNTYMISYNSQYGSQNKTVFADEVIHWRNTFSNDNGLTGVGTLKYAAQSLSLAATNDRQAKENAAKGGKYKIILKEEQRPDFALNLLNKEQKNKQVENLQNALNDSKDVLLMSGLMDAQVISQDSVQMQLLENRKFDITTIARYTGVPLVLLMDYSNNTYKAPEQAMQAFLAHTISPMANSLEMEINAKILGSIGYPSHRFHFIDESLMRLDPMGRANLGKVLLETGVKCVNELRAENDLPSIIGGDRHYISTNLQPIDSPVVEQVDSSRKKGGKK